MNIYDRIGKFGLYSLLEGTDRLGNADTWFVDGNSGNAANNANVGQGASWDLPFSTLNYAISRCSNDASNVIFVAADHTENWSTKETASGTTTTGACVDKSGVTIIGCGTQDRRPTFTTTATVGCLNVIATECSLYNLVFKSNYADTVVLIITDSGGDGLLVENCEFRDLGASLEHKLAISIAANCNDTTIRGCRFLVSDGATASEAAIRFVGAHYRSTIQDCFFRGDWGGDSSDGVIDASTTASFDMLIDGNIINNMDATYGAGIEVHASTTGVVSNNIVYCIGTAGAPIEAAGCVKANNKTTVSVGYEAAEGGVSSIGKTFYVDSGSGVVGNLGTSWADAVTTIDTAVDLCTADNGDTILVAAGHNEVLTGATTFVCDIDKNSITIIGLGNGTNRPLIEVDTVSDGVVEISADNITIENIVFAVEDVDNMEYMIRVDGLNCTIKNCDFLEGTEQALTCITVGVSTDTNADGLTIDGCKFLAPTDDDMTSAISIIKDMDNVTIKNCLFQGSFDNACIELVSNADACTNLHILDNIMINTLTGQHCIQISGVVVTGLITGNTFINDTRDQATQPSLCQMVNNKWSKLGTGMVGVDNVDPLNSGLHIFVDSTATGAADTAGHGYSWAEPLATLDAAMALCTASSGDVIHLAPGHAENCDTAGTHIDFDIAGVKVIGHGTGTDRPTFTFITQVTGDIEINAANCSIENVIFINDVTGLDAPINVDAAHFTMKNCVFRDLGTDLCDNWIVGDANADYLTIEDCYHEGTNSAGGVSWLSVTGATHLTVKNCISNGDFSAGNIVFGSAMTDVLITGCHLTNHNAVDVNIEGFAASDGMISYCSLSIITDIQTTWINTPGNMTTYECYGTNVVGEAGMFIGTVSQ